MAHKNSHSAPRKKGGALKIVLVLLVLLLVVAGGGVWMAKREIDGGTPGEEVPVSIQQGSGVGTIANALKEAGVIKFPRLFRWYVGKQGAFPEDRDVPLRAQLHFLSYDRRCRL